ncbi:ClbS/DfsB family four-helix bundle protein [Sulfitobacter aestuariivivens]|uniref:ClbS/DfsB family four-helix bundle protein n=1 Tax=Sulfitobacter aestuariivivens TaxID=2766981 RepID=A0A927D733_9RHOB|nr:ClbS/DfsB family four-helix bundle protein [Sulfitobacter aestuariivivens]
MACTTKAELITLTQKEYAKIQKLLAPLDHAAASLGEPGVSIKDMIGHRAHWTDLCLRWYTDGKAGQEVFFPAEG